MAKALVTWLRAQLDEDERVARAAGKRALDWPVNGTWWLEGVEHDRVGDEEAFCHPHNAEHIARWDPARVLAEVDAKRRILDELAISVPEGDPDGWLSSVARLLALPYADRPGYRKEWRPDSVTTR